jgi:hypothetical protein
MAVTQSELEDQIVRLRALHANRNGEYDLSRRRYAGELWDDVTNPATRGRYSLSPNYLKPITDKSIQLLMGQIPAIQVLPPGTDQASRDQAEKLEALLYRTWQMNNAGGVFKKVAWDSFVLRRGMVYYKWDHKKGEVCFYNITPDDFYPEYDGDEMYSAIYVQKRLTKVIRAEYPGHEDEIFDDIGGDLAQIDGQDPSRMEAQNYVTCYYYFERGGDWAFKAGNFFKTGSLEYPVPDLPFIEFPCYIVGGNREPMNGLDQLVELNQYLAQLLSQKADVIARYANPVVLDYQSGQGAAALRSALSAPGAVVPVRRDGDVKFLNWEGTSPDFDTQLELIMDIIFDLAGKPRSSFGQTVTNQSGVITNLSLTPTLQSNEYHEDLWSERLVLLNERILQLYEKFGGDHDYVFRGRVPVGLNLTATKYRYTITTKDDIRGWYNNRIKWPAAIRIDDPVYVQNQLAQLQSDPPAISLYTYLENMGIQDVEAEIDRIKEQLEDPRLHPEVMEAGINAVTQLAGGSAEGAAMAGEGAEVGGDANGALAATGSPYADALA